MDAKTLIDQVRECQDKNWQNSDLWKESEKMLEIIAEHFESCEECRKQFDDMGYTEQTLIEFEARLNGTELSDWVCSEV